MRLLTRIARDSLWLLIARVGAQVSLMVVTYLLARRLGAAGFGEYAFLAALIMTGNVLTTFGSDMHLIREIAAEGNFSDVPSVLIVQLALSFLFIGLIFLVAPYLPHQTPTSALALKIYSLALIPLAFFTVFTSALRGAEEMTAYALMNFLLPLLQAIAIFFFIQRGTSLVTLIYLLLVVQMLGAILGGILCRITIPQMWSGFHFTPGRIVSLFRACLPIALIAIAGIVFQKMSLAMLSFMSVAATVGVFSAALRVSEAARMGHVAVFTVLYPAMANARRDQPSENALKYSWLLLLAVSAAGSLLLFLLAKPIVDIFFGAEYGASVAVLKILALALIPYTVNAYLSLTLLAKKQEQIILRVMVVSLLALFALNLWLIPRVGEVGAGEAVLVTEIVQAILFSLAWMKSPLRQNGVRHPKGVWRELSDPSR